MKILSISLDSNLLRKGMNDSKLRQIEYGKHLDKLVVLTAGQSVKRINNISEKVKIIRFDSFREAFRIGSILCGQNKPNLIISQDPIYIGLIGYLIKRRFNIPLCLEIHTDIFTSGWVRERIANRFLLILAWFLLRRADSVRVVSQLLAGKLKSAKIKANVIIMPTGAGVEVSQFNARRDPQAGNNLRKKILGNAQYVILFVGRLAREKNLSNLIRAFSLLSPHYKSKLVLVGEGPERDKLRVICRQLGVSQSVKFIGRVSYKYVPVYYAASNVVVLSSNYEGFARVLIEAGASGKPVVTTNVGGVIETIKSKVNGLVVENNQPQEFARAIADVLSHGGYKAKTVGPKVAGKFNRKDNVVRLVKFWEQNA